MKIFVTKYALTQGILTYDNATVRENSVVASVRRGGYCDQYFHRKEWHTNFENAVKKAEDMRDKKLKSLQKSIIKLKGLTFIEPMS